ncbi:MAG: dTMP kinase [Atopobiaceae bacterium]|nr:dTMP kinase [Atopobiaceae bacterium]
MNRRGTFVTFEGVDGCGKTTQAALLVGRLEAAGADVLALREPGGTAISEKIRALLLDPTNGEMCADCELLLYEAARAQLVRQVIEPALARGTTVVCDRFYDSTTAYQAAARGLDGGLVRVANELGSCGIVPDRTIVFDLDPEVALARATAGSTDRLEAEGLSFQQHVREGFLALAHREPGRVRMVDAIGPVEAVSTALDAALDGLGLPVLSDGGQDA